MHRALETLAKEGMLPDEAALAAALRQEGLPAGGRGCPGPPELLSPAHGLPGRPLPGPAAGPPRTN